jgi:hypothetical protein
MGWTDEQRARQAERMRKAFSADTVEGRNNRRKITQGVKAYYADNEHPNKGGSMSPQAKERIREGVQAYYANGGVHPNKGVPMTEAHKDKIRQAMLRRSALIKALEEQAESDDK